MIPEEWERKDRMLSIRIGYGKRNSQWLTLPTNRTEVYEAIGKMMEANGWDPMREEPSIRNATSNIPNLPDYLDRFYYSVPEAMNQLNFLAARIAWLDTRERDIFSKALEILKPMTLKGIIEITYNLDRFEMQEGVITENKNQKWNYALDDEMAYKLPFGKDVAFFLHVHMNSGPGESSFALRLPQKEKIWERFENWVNTDKPGKVKTVQCGGVFGELWDYLPVSSTWKEVDDFSEFLMNQKIENTDVFMKELINCIEAKQPQSMDEVCQLVAGLTGSEISQDVHAIRLYSTLEGELFPFNEQGRFRMEGYPLAPVDLVQYQQAIDETLQREDWIQRHLKGFVELLENKLLQQRIISMRPMTEAWKGELWGVLEVKSHRELLPEELDKVIEQWKGIAAAGWGPQIRGMEIKAERGKMHLGFWNSSPEFRVLTEEQLKQNELILCESQTQGLTMG